VFSTLLNAEPDLYFQCGRIHPDIRRLCSDFVDESAHNFVRFGEGSVPQPTLCLVGDRKAELFPADLSGVDLTNANLRGADLQSANLERAILTGADLREANLRSKM
jgi:hypothetical protein